MHAPVTPRLTVDIIVELCDRPDRPILLIERRYPPPGWALPGGFVDVGETLEQAAVREAAEEICLPVTLTTLLGCYSDPARDPRQHTVSAVYIAEARGEPRAADDAATVQAFALHDLPTALAFDHALILDDYRRFRESGRRTPLRHV
ncbi:MAG: NUDIX hydrolase [Gammaproteobacteria bacterium]|nr:NUDIX hydrolase [Gammaproteobacteria bacterium]